MVRSTSGTLGSLLTLETWVIDRIRRSNCGHASGSFSKSLGYHSLGWRSLVRKMNLGLNQMRVPKELGKN